MAHDLDDRVFWVARESEVKSAETSDVYFRYTVDILKSKGLNPMVTMEVYARSVPYKDNWGIVTGVYEVAKLLEGLPVSVRAVEEGEIFVTNPHSVVYEPLLQITGRYTDFALYENPILGLLCSSSGISTKAGRIRLAAWGKMLFSFGTRRVHPVIAPMVERGAYIAGFDAVSNMLGARLMKVKPMGTMPHALIQCFGDQKAAWTAFHETQPPETPRIMLIDTFYDEKAEAVMAYETLQDSLYGVRIDTPSSRRGDWKKIIEEVRWELKIRGGSGVQIYVSGGLDEEQIGEINELVDGYGVGTSVSAAPVIDMSAKIVEITVDGKSLYRAKRGDIGGRKEGYRREGTFEDLVTLAGRPAPEGYTPLMGDLVKNGEIVADLRPVSELRERTLSRLERLRNARPSLRWV